MELIVCALGAAICIITGITIWGILVFTVMTPINFAVALVKKK